MRETRKSKPRVNPDDQDASDRRLEASVKRLEELTPDVDWEEEERLFQYRRRVWECLGQAEKALLDESAEVEGELSDRYYEHTVSCFKFGTREQDCASRWLLRIN